MAFIDINKRHQQNNNCLNVREDSSLEVVFATQLVAGFKLGSFEQMTKYRIYIHHINKPRVVLYGLFDVVDNLLHNQSPKRIKEK